MLTPTQRSLLVGYLEQKGWDYTPKREIVTRTMIINQDRRTPYLTAIDELAEFIIDLAKKDK